MNNFFDIIVNIIGMGFSFLPIIIFFYVVSVASKKKVTQETPKKLPKKTPNNELSLDDILKEIRSLSTRQKIDTEVKNYETSSYEIQNYDTKKNEIQNYETASREVINYDEIYIQKAKERRESTTLKTEKPKKKSEQTKRVVAQKQKQTIFTNKNDLKKAFIIAEILKTKF